MVARLRTWARSRLTSNEELFYLLAFNSTNAVNYGYLIVMGLMLSTEGYGLFGALFGLIYLTSSIGNTVQVAVASQVAELRSRMGAVSRRHLLGAFLPALLLATVTLLAFLLVSAPLGDSFGTSRSPILWAGFGAALSILVPAGYGALQGLQRFQQLGVSQFVAAVARVTLGIGLVVAGFGPTGALAGVAIGYIPSGVLAALYAERQAARLTAEPATATLPAIGSLVAILLASLAVAAPTSVDVALVKHFFSAEEAGIYTAIAVLGRVVLFVPLAISFILLPKVVHAMARGRETRSYLLSSLGQAFALAVATAIGLAVVVEVLGWSPVGREISLSGDALFWYLAAMVAFSMLVPLIYYQIACGNLRNLLGIVVPAIVGQVVAVALFHGSLTAVAQALFAVNIVLLTLTLAPTFLAQFLDWARAPVPQMSARPEVDSYLD